MIAFSTRQLLVYRRVVGGIGETLLVGFFAVEASGPAGCRSETSRIRPAATVFGICARPTPAIAASAFPPTCNGAVESAAGKSASMRPFSPPAQNSRLGPDQAEGNDSMLSAVNR